MSVSAQIVNATPRVLVFDSGVGGLSVFDAIAASGLALDLDYAADNAWLPYGLKSDVELRDRVPALLAALAAQWMPDVVVLACNTASTIALEEVRGLLSVPVVGVVPPIKPAAAQTKTGTIGLLATPATVARAYTDELISRFAPDKHLIRFGSSALVNAAEAKLRGDGLDGSAMIEAIKGLFDAPGGGEIDVIALACTHFPLLAGELAAAAPHSCVWLDSGAAIARRVGQVSAALPGTAHARRIGFTDLAAARALQSALEARGFERVFAIDAHAGFAAHSP